MPFCNNCNKASALGTTTCPYCGNTIRQLSKDSVIEYIGTIDDVLSIELPFRVVNFDDSFFRLDIFGMLRYLSQGLNLPQCNFRLIELPLENQAAQFIFQENAQRLKSKGLMFDPTTLTVYREGEKVSKLSVSIRVDPRFKNSAELVGASLAHEIAHFYLMINKRREKIFRKAGIFVNTEVAGEYITDLTTIRLGFGILLIKGYEIRKTLKQSGRLMKTETIETIKLGYLTVEELLEAESFLCKKYSHAHLSHGRPE